MIHLCIYIYFENHHHGYLRENQYIYIVLVRGICTIHFSTTLYIQNEKLYKDEIMYIILIYFESYIG